MIIEYSKERKDINSTLDTIDAVYGGNFFVKKDVSRYLRKAPGESSESFQRRSDTAVFYNFLKPIIRLASERPFSNQITYSDNFPEQFEPIKSNFDGLGNGLLFNAYEAFLKGIKHGFVGIAPDYDNESKTPFARLIDARDIIGVWKKSNSDGSYYYDRVQFVVRNSAVEEQLNADGSISGYKEVLRSKIIELIHPNIMRTYNVKAEKSSENGISFEVDLVVGDDGASEVILEGFEKIPFHLFTTEQPIDSESTIRIIPSFYDLSLINLSHYNKQSDQDNIMTVSRYAILCASGVNDEDFEKQFKQANKAKVIGPFTLLLFSRPDSKVYFAEHSGKAIEAGQNDIIKTEKSMTSLLKDYLQRQVVMETATEKNIAEKHANLYTVYLANKLEQVMTNVLKDFATYMNFEIENTENLISFSRDYSAAETSKKIDAIIKAREMGDLTTKDFLSQLASLNVFSGDFDPEEASERVIEEAGESLVQNQQDEDDDEVDAFTEDTEPRD